MSKSHYGFIFTVQLGDMNTSSRSIGVKSGRVGGCLDHFGKGRDSCTEQHESRGSQSIL